MDYEPNNPPILKSKQTNEQGKKTHNISSEKQKGLSSYQKKKKLPMNSNNSLSEVKRKKNRLYTSEYV